MERQKEDNNNCVETYIALSKRSFYDFSCSSILILDFDFNLVMIHMTFSSIIIINYHRLRLLICSLVSSRIKQLPTHCDILFVGKQLISFVEAAKVVDIVENANAAAVNLENEKKKHCSTTGKMATIASMTMIAFDEKGGVNNF